MQITSGDADESKNKKYCDAGLAAVSKTLTFYATYMHLTFVSDYSGTRSGFNITYKVLARKGYSLQYAYIMIIIVVIDIIVIITTTGQYGTVIYHQQQIKRARRYQERKINTET